MSQGATARLMLTGDNFVFATNPQPNACYAKVASTLHQADARFGNLEFPLTGVMPLEAQKAVAYEAYGAPLNPMRMDASCIDMLKFARYDVVGLANNHHWDYGVKGSQETRDSLNNAGIAFCGAGSNAEEAYRPAIIERNGVRLAFLSYTMVYLPHHAATLTGPGMATLKIHTTFEAPLRLLEQPGTQMEVKTFPDAKASEDLHRAIQDAKQKADVVICSFHWGVSVNRFGGAVLRRLTDYQVQVGRACIDSGAVLVVGHHAHSLQGVERYKHGVIAYSLGNFVSSTGGAIKFGFPPQSVIADCILSKDGLTEFSFIPVMQDEDGVPEVVDGKAADSVFEWLQTDSKDLQTKLTRRNGKIYIEAQ